MRLWTALLMTMALTACIPAEPGADERAISETTLPPPNAAPDADATPAPAPPAPASEAHPEAPPPEVQPETPAEPEAPMLARQRAACAETGGRLMPRGRGFYACVQQTRDAGQRCDSSDDCQGLCLARSGTCAPLHPLFGCQEVFTLPGRRETLCTE
jgi:hypothetical protein